MQKPDVFTVHYVLKNKIGELVDTSEGSEPLHFLYGSPGIIAGIQEAVKERNVGDCLEVTVPPSMAYGEHNPELIRTVPKSMFEGIENLEVGMKFQTNTGDNAQIVQVVGIDGKDIAEGTPKLTLAIVWQLMRADVLQAHATATSRPLHGSHLPSPIMVTP